MLVSGRVYLMSLLEDDGSMCDLCVLMWSM